MRIFSVDSAFCFVLIGFFFYFALNKSFNGEFLYRDLCYICTVEWLLRLTS